MNRHVCHQDQAYLCIRCGKEFSKPEDADRHIATCGDEDAADVKWSMAQEDALMQAMLEKYQTFVALPTNKMKRRFWEELAEQLGIDVARWVEVRKKWHNVCMTYRRRKDLAGPRNSGRGATKTWVHYDIMDQILGDSPATEPSYVIATNDKGSENDKRAVLKTIENLPNQTSTATSSRLQIKQANATVKSEAISPHVKRRRPSLPGTGHVSTTPSSRRTQPTSSATSGGITYQQYLAEKMKQDARKADNDTRRTEAIVSLVDCFKAATERENLAPQQKLVSLATEFMKLSNLILTPHREMTVEETVDVFHDVVTGLKRV